MSEPNNGSPEEAVPERAPLNPRTEEALRALQRLAEEDPHIAELLEPLARLARKDGQGLSRKLKGDLIGVFYRGPLPPPEMLWGYEKIVPGAAKRILTQFERQSEHRREIERKMVSNIARREMGSILVAALLIVAVTFLGYHMVSQGQSLYALGTVAASVSGVLIAFFTGKKANLREKEEKRELLKELMESLEGSEGGLKDQERKGGGGP
jgi:uncharacterized membrane protein